MEVLFDFGGVGDFQVLRIPLDPGIQAVVVESPPGADGYVAKLDQLGQRAGMLEVSAGGFTALAGGDPFLVVPDRSRDGLGRTFVWLLWLCGPPR